MKCCCVRNFSVGAVTGKEKKRYAVFRVGTSVVHQSQAALVRTSLFCNAFDNANNMPHRSEF